MIRRLPSSLVCLSLSLSLAGLGGCALQGPTNSATSAAAAVKATGMVHGGQQPVTGATIQLYAAGTAGYGSPATPLIGATLTTSDGTGLLNSNANAGNANNTLSAGAFTITGDYTCPTGSTLVYLTATGGNPGLTAGTNNSAIVLIAALGQCGALSPSTFVSVNEVTTVASIYSLAQFASVSGDIGSVSTSTTGIANAFANVNNMVNIGTGAALTATTGGNAVPQSEINTIADILVPCVNSTGPASSACATLFSAATPSAGAITPPTTVLGAALYMALYPRSNVSSLFNISTANAAFQPTLTVAPNNWDIVVGGAAQSACGYSGSGYRVSGTVSYSGTKTGQIYLALGNTTCSGGGTWGTSISAKGGYTIRGVPPGTYNVFAYMDPQGYGAQNAVDPSGSAVVTVGSSDAFASVTLSDPATVTIASAPSIQSVSPFNSGFLAQYNAIKSNSVETATSYTLQWSTTSSFTAIDGSKTFPAVGTHGATVWVVNGLTDASVYYFRAYGTSAGTAVGPYSSTYGPVTIGAPSTGSSVSGAVAFTGTPTGPMYAGIYNQYTGSIYLQYIANPVSAQAYSVVVPNSATAVYEPIAVIDQNNDGVIDAGDIQNTEGHAALVAITSTTNLNQTLPAGNSTAAVATNHYSSGSYGFTVQVSTAAKLPVAVSLLSSSNSDGANVSGPMDVALCGQNGTSCGKGFQLSFGLGTTAPAVGDTYFFYVTYSDGTTEIVTATDTAVLNSFATSLAPTTGSSNSTTPTFTWTAPVCGACSSYLYQFSLQVVNGSQIWQVPGNANGLPYSTTSLTWAVDPTSAGNTPSVGSLTAGTNYSWSIYVTDTDNNQAITQVNYIP